MRVTLPGPTAAPRGRGRGAATSKAAQAAMEKAQARYISLACGHFASREVAAVYEAWRPDRISVFCEHDSCQDFREIAKVTTRYKYPDSPLF